ncbi:Type III restriction-modification system methylation subunit [Anoxybacillus flavithermus]|uniref:Type III restriction-modification system methylation subunit n=1 Tax=Anoxybacillus flavithermus TaxID=33934 RepID=A0A178TL12_9BACL|nr:site-specific DNA-methyltransferase [Anoxybacillus flavithermus]OAO81977.1 Type III restriction-modification system methylation subunit [Anoxybacillus flavithermus]
MAQKQRLELTWIGKDEQPKLEPRILLEDPELSYHAKERVTENDIFDNRLIFGDNLLALKALEQEFTGKIKCIYIDPPYNTGNAFEHYDDGLEHSIWLTLMKHRLEILAKLLHNDGLLAVQIDDNEFARLYLLMSEIFGEKNLKTVVVKMSEASGVKMGSVKSSGSIPKLKEYIILAKKNGVKNLNVELIPKSEWDNEYNLFLDNFSREDRAIIDEISNKEEKSDDDIRTIDEICSKIQLISVSEKIKSLGIKQNEQMKWKFDNAWRIVRTAASKSVFLLTEEKKKYINQTIFSVLSVRDKVLYLVKSDYQPTSKQPRVQLLFADSNLMIHPGDLWTDIKTTGLEAEGGVSFKNGKKPESLIKRIIGMSTNEGDWVLDSFAGSGTTGAVAHKMGRRWIMIELGEHCHTHIIPRMKRVIDGTDQGGISKAVNWQGGGGFRYYKLAPSLLKKDKFGNWIINPEYNAEMLAEAMCKHEGFTYNPDPHVFWKQGQSTENDFIYTTTQLVTQQMVAGIVEQMKENETLLICCKAYNVNVDEFPQITIKKIPQAILNKCEFGRDDYSLNVNNLPMKEREPEQLELF